MYIHVHLAWCAEHLHMKYNVQLLGIIVFCKIIVSCYLIIMNMILFHISRGGQLSGADFTRRAGHQN